MRQTALVTKCLPDNMVELSVKRESACGGDCHACGGTCAFKNKMKINANNKASATVGDKVVVESSTGGIMVAVFIVYLMPIIFFFIGYVSAALMGATERMCIITSVTAFFAGVLLAVCLNHWYKAKRLATFDVVSVLSR